MKAGQKGFTIVELLIVVAVIGIIAAIVIASFNTVQARSRTAKIDADFTALEKAIQSARITSGEVALRYVTGTTATMSNCISLPSNADLTDKTATASCWSAYASALDKISVASGQNVRGMVDPYGRPYFIDENEKEGATTCGTGKDYLAIFPQPRTQNSWSSDNKRYIPYITPGC